METSTITESDCVGGPGRDGGQFGVDRKFRFTLNLEQRDKNILRKKT